MRNRNGFLSKILTCLLVCSSATSCHFSSTYIKTPQFNIPADSINRRIQAIVSCENLMVSGSETKTDGKLSSRFTISILNGKRLPEEIAGMELIGKKIAAEMKKSIQNDSAYEVIRVQFVHEEKKGIVTNTNTEYFDYPMKNI